MKLSTGDSTASYFEIPLNLYTCLVGEQGDGKTTAMRIAKGVMKRVYPTLPMSANVMSREDIVRLMASEAYERSVKYKSGTLEEVRPFAMFINELDNFISFNRIGMIQFLTDIYDEKVFDSSTIARGVEAIINPHVTINACVVPDLLKRDLKASVITGGFCRRMIFVYVVDPKGCIPRPTPSKTGLEALARVEDRLRHIVKTSYPQYFTWEPETDEWWDAKYRVWHREAMECEDPLVKGFKKSKHIQVLKCAGLLAIAEEDDCVLRVRYLEAACAMLDTNEINMPLLSRGVGASKLAIPMSHILDMLRASDGALPVKKLTLMMQNDLQINEFEMVMKQLDQSDQVKKVNVTQKGVTREMYMLKDKYDELLEAQKPKP